MAFDPTVGGANANSYATVAEADAYADTLSFRTAWPATGTSDAAKEGALQQAARLLDTRVWKGKKASSAQALAWPRYGVVDRDGYTLASDSIPAKVKQAQCELAVQLLAGDRTSQDALQATRVKVGPIESEYSVGAQPQIIPSVVLAMVADLLASGGTTSIRLVRA